MSSNIRKATIDDSKRLAEIVAKSWQTAYKGIVADEVIDDKHTQERIGKLTKYFSGTISNEISGDYIITTDSTDVGCFSFGASRDAAPNEKTGELIGLYILLEYRGCGRGCKVLSFVDEEAKKRGYDKIILWVLKKNKRAICFYQKNGYVFANAARTVTLGNEQLVEIQLEKIFDKEKC